MVMVKSIPSRLSNPIPKMLTRPPAMQATPPWGVTRFHRNAASKAGVRLAPTSE